MISDINNDYSHNPLQVVTNDTRYESPQVKLPQENSFKYGLKSSGK